MCSHLAVLEMVAFILPSFAQYSIHNHGISGNNQGLALISMIVLQIYNGQKLKKSVFLDLIGN